MSTWKEERVHYYQDAAGALVVMVRVFRTPEGRKLAIPFMYLDGEFVYGLGGAWHLRGERFNTSCWVPIEGATDLEVAPGKSGAIWISKWQRVLYRLPALLKALHEKPDSFIFICEGEKDADTVADLGLTATTNYGGAGGFRVEDVPLFENAHVVLCEDNDEAGRKHVRKVARLLRGTAASIRIVTFRELPEHGDVTDWLSAQEEVQNNG